MDRNELQKIIGKLRFGDGEQIRLKKLLEETDAGSTPERIDAWLNDALLRVGDCPPDALALWAQSLTPQGRVEARRKVEAIRAVVLAMEMFLEEVQRIEVRESGASDD